MSGLFLKFSAIRSLLLRGLNPNGEDALVYRLSLILSQRNDREVVLANIHYLILLCPNDHEDALVRSLEHFHRFMGFYHPERITSMTFFPHLKVVI
jgi:hypothetical protein